MKRLGAIVIVAVGCARGRGEPARATTLVTAPPPGPCVVGLLDTPAPKALPAPLDLVTIEEDLALRRKPDAMWIYGADLARARELLERNGVFEDARARRAIVSPEVTDGATVTLRIRYVDGAEQELVVTNCVALSACSFLRDAFMEHLIPRIPDVCSPLVHRAFANRVIGDSCASAFGVDQRCWERRLAGAADAGS
ncbi:MAG TPA: hypothetical protein VF316_24980, partial [Polyangiaceae bacterium]